MRTIEVPRETVEDALLRLKHYREALLKEDREGRGAGDRYIKATEETIQVLADKLTLDNIAREKARG